MIVFDSSGHLVSYEF